MDGYKGQNYPLTLTPLATPLVRFLTAFFFRSVHLPLGSTRLETAIEKIQLTRKFKNMKTDYKHERSPLTKTSMISNVMAPPIFPPEKYRAAIGFSFDYGLSIDTVEYLVCQTMIDVQEGIEEDECPNAEPLLGSAFFQTDPNTGNTRAIILWKDNRQLDWDAAGSWLVAQELSELVEISPYREELLAAQKFVMGSKTRITTYMMKRLQKFMMDGKYPWRNGLLS
jgi:hypothetical protein